MKNIIFKQFYVYLCSCSDMIWKCSHIKKKCQNLKSLSLRGKNHHFVKWKFSSGNYSASKVYFVLTWVVFSQEHQKTNSYYHKILINNKLWCVLQLPILWRCEWWTVIHENSMSLLVWQNTNVPKCQKHCCHCKPAWVFYAQKRNVCIYWKYCDSLLKY